MRAAQKNAYDRRNPKGKTLKKGDIVLLENHRQQTKDADQKLRKQFSGPYRVSTDAGRGAVWLEDQEGRRLGPYNLRFLKRTNKVFVGLTPSQLTPRGVVIGSQNYYLLKYILLFPFTGKGKKRKGNEAVSKDKLYF